ncbi:MAG: EpsG family protein [Prevotellaceae bacterium]|jgi:hypothetical protein|nr:EpsG family protein [Prevotellaceae bacterium]
MLYYLTCFAISTFLFWLGQNIKPARCEKIFRWSAYGAALLIPAVLAGIRDNSVGTDMMIYGVPIFESACQSADFNELFSRWGMKELGYLWLNYTVAQITHNQIYFFGLIMFVQVLFVFLALRRWQDKFPIWLGMLVFYLLFFHPSLNIMRQMLALSIAFFGMQYAFERKFFLFAFWVLLGFLFHYATLLLLLYYPLFWYANKFSSKKAVILFIGAGIVIVMLLMPVLADFLYSLGGTAQYISYHFAKPENSGGFPFNTLIFYSLPAILFFINREKILSAFPKTGYFFQYITALLVILPFMLFAGGDWTVRFTYSVTWWLVVLMPAIGYSFDKLPKTLLNTAIIAYCLFYWYVSFIFLNYGETAHYLTVFAL